MVLSHVSHVMNPQVEVKGLVLVGVSLAREVVPSFARVLLHTTLGRHMLRSLLRSEIAQVTTRRAWHDASKLTSETIDLYKVRPVFLSDSRSALTDLLKPLFNLSNLLGDILLVESSC